MLDALDEIVLSAGGALNPYKDHRMSPEMFAASFPNWAELEALRDPALMSDFWRRTAMRLEPRHAAGKPDLARPQADCEPSCLHGVFPLSNGCNATRVDMR
jgi:hypothetical protein